MRRALTGVLGVAPKALGASPRRLETAIGRLLAALDAPGEPRDRLWGARGGPKAVPGASARVPETALGAQDGPRSIFHRFWVDLGWIFDDFRCDLDLILLAFSLPLPLLVRLLLETTSIVSLQFPPSHSIFKIQKKINFSR